MALQITNISINFNNGQMGDVNVYFNSRYDQENRNVNVNGNVALTGQEYLQNSSTEALLDIVTERINNHINADADGVNAQAIAQELENDESNQAEQHNNADNQVAQQNQRNTNNQNNQNNQNGQQTTRATTTKNRNRNN